MDEKKDQIADFETVVAEVRDRLTRQEEARLRQKSDIETGWSRAFAERYAALGR